MQREVACSVVLSAGESVEREGGVLWGSWVMSVLWDGVRSEGRDDEEEEQNMEKTFEIKDGKEGRKKNDAFTPNGSRAISTAS